MKAMEIETSICMKCLYIYARMSPKEDYSIVKFEKIKGLFAHLRNPSYCGII